MNGEQNFRNFNESDFCGQEERCEQEERRGENCGCNENRGLEYFHELVRAAQHEFKEGAESSRKAIFYAEKAVCMQKKAIRENQQAKALLAKAFEWLYKYGCRYDCNVGSQSCQQLARQLQCLARKIEKLEACGLKELEEGLALLRQAECIDKKFGCLVREYLECIHNRCRGNNHDCECERNDDCNWD